MVDLNGKWFAEPLSQAALLATIFEQSGRNQPALYVCPALCSGQ
jgi:hypothetical protein